ncbi:hypothetical protein [Nocardioides sp. AE5]|uniref:hypothetical protein n=1 Tax=Nocardioides sp. AE5 TaxID=2962573 RepID=UPI002882741E|nr:hypothetical protein [Nocardioides sp. AE5]MDT0203036.1 hypothetical protein [Nocardioides sp. AE5]
MISTQPGDRFVLTSKGVHGVLEAARFTDLVVAEDRDPDAVVAAVEAAVLDAGAPDNYAIVVVDLAG